MTRNTQQQGMGRLSWGVMIITTMKQLCEISSERLAETGFADAENGKISLHHCELGIDQATACGKSLVPLPSFFALVLVHE